MENKKRILFLCTGNSARSQMAEALMNRLGGDEFVAFSAGSNPQAAVHPLAIKTMHDMGIDISQNSTKSMDKFLHEPWDVIITVCDNAREACPIFPGQVAGAHWGFDDPAAFEGDDDEKEEMFVNTAVGLEQRIRLFLALPHGELAHHEYVQALQEIGKS
ncbi:MAG: arsenate reductase ArsC [bacterium]